MRSIPHPKAIAEYSVASICISFNTFGCKIPAPKISKVKSPSPKIIFPSLTKYQETPESIRFASNYKKINNVNPNQYAIRGFDVVFDTMLRLSQTQSFEQTIQNTATEGVENKFDYEKKLASGYTNKGVYIMYYDEDLTVKTAE